MKERRNQRYLTVVWHILNSQHYKEQNADTKNDKLNHHTTIADRIRFFWSARSHELKLYIFLVVNILISQKNDEELEWSYIDWIQKMHNNL